MRTTVAIDDEILARAQELTGIKEKSRLIIEALNALIQRESAPAAWRGWVEARRKSDRPLLADGKRRVVLGI